MSFHISSLASQQPFNHALMHLTTSISHCFCMLTDNPIGQWFLVAIVFSETSATAQPGPTGLIWKTRVRFCKIMCETTSLKLCEIMSVVSCPTCPTIPIASIGSFVGHLRLSKPRSPPVGLSVYPCPVKSAFAPKEPSLKPSPSKLVLAEQAGIPNLREAEWTEICSAATSDPQIHLDKDPQEPIQQTWVRQNKIQYNNCVYNCFNRLSIHAPSLKATDQDQDDDPKVISLQHLLQHPQHNF